MIQRVWEFPTCKRLDENSVPDPACQVVKRVKIVIKHGQILHSWEQRKLSELAEIVGGGTPDTNNSAYWDGDIDWYAPAEMEGQRYAVSSVRKITELGLQKSSAKMLPAHRTVLFTSRAGIGKMAILQRPAATNQGFQSLVLRDGTDPYFIYSMGDKIKGIAEGVASGSTFLEISGKMLGSLEVMTPSIEEQKEIASFFRGIDDLITLHQRKYDQLVNIKKSMLEKMFPRDGASVPEIRFSGFTDPWEQRKVGEVSKRVIVGLATSVTPYYREEGVPILRNLNIKENYLDDTDILFLDRPYAESQVSKQIHAGDVLTVHTGYIGISCVVPEKYDNCLTFTTLITTTDDDVLEGAFLAQYLNSEIGMSAVQAVTTQGGRQNLNTNDFVKVEIRYPSLAEQSKICAVLSRIDNLITLHQRKLEKLKNIKKSMLEKMFV